MVAGRRRKQKLRGGNGRQTRKAQNLNNECDPMNKSIRLPDQTPTASPMLLHTICLNQGRVAVRSRHAFASALLARAEKLAAAGGWRFHLRFGSLSPEAADGQQRGHTHPGTGGRRRWDQELSLGNHVSDASGRWLSPFTLVCKEILASARTFATASNLRPTHGWRRS
jgi:hypothetical protein